MSVVVRNFLRNLLPAAALAAVLGFGAMVASPVYAGLVVVGSPSSTNHGSLQRASLRWGNTSAEAGIRSGINTNSDLVSLNPTGTPVWRDGLARDFRMSYSAATGTFTLEVDFDRVGGFANASGSPEVVSWNYPVLLNQGFTGIAVFNNAQDISITNFQLNNQTFTPVTNATTYYEDTNGLMSNFTATGTIQFPVVPTGNGQFSGESRWEIRLYGPAAVPEPGSLSLLVVGLAGLVGIRRRRS